MEQRVNIRWHIDADLQKADYTAASNKLNNLSANISTYPLHLQDELNDYVDLKEKLITNLSNNIPLDSLSDTDHTYITNIAENGVGLGSYQARELLCFFYNECWEYPVEIIENQQQSQRMVLPQVEEEIEERSFAIYPNPANTWVSIVLPESDDKFEIIVRDLAGKIIYQKQAQRNLVSWDISNISNGIYMVSVYTIGTQEILGTQKVIVQH